MRQIVFFKLKFFGSKFFFGLINLFGPKFLLDLNFFKQQFFLEEIFFRTEIFWAKNFFWTEILFWQNFFWPYNFGTKIFGDQTFFGNKHLLGQKIFGTNNFVWDQQIFGTIFFNSELIKVSFNYKNKAHKNVECRI